MAGYKNVRFVLPGKARTFDVLGTVFEGGLVVIRGVEDRNVANTLHSENG